MTTNSTKNQSTILEIVEPTAAARTLPKHLQSSSLQQQQQPLDCGCEDENGQCLTASWERAFQAALQTTVEQTIVSNSSTEVAATTKKRSDTGSSSTSVSETVMEENNIEHAPPDPSDDTTKKSTTTEPFLKGLQCSSCDQPSIVLYPSGDTQGQLICKQCRRSRRKQTQRRTAPLQS